MEKVWKPIFNLPGKKCFGCGQANEIGLQLEFESDGTHVRTRTQIPERLAGWANLTHGGITATILDETLAWTVIYLKRRFILTKSISVRYLKPIFIGDTVLCEGKILEENSDRDVIAEAVATNPAGQVLARAEGIIATFDKEGMQKFGFLDEEFLEEFRKKVLLQ